MSTSIACVMFTLKQCVNNLSLAQFQSDEQNDQILINANVPDGAVKFCQQRLNSVISVSGNLDIKKSLCDLLELAFDFIEPKNGIKAEFHEKMAIMVTDFTLNLDVHFCTMSDEFIHRGITLVVVATGMIPAPVVLERYRTPARSTGGEYILLEDAASVLQRIVLSTIHGGDTLRQAFYHMSIKHDLAAPTCMNEATDGVGELTFNHGLSQ